MGLAQAKQTPRSLLWIDLEGGMGDKPIWDAAVVHDTPDGALSAVRFCRHETKYHRTKLKQSLPEHTFAGMHPQMTYMVSYAFADDTWKVAGAKPVKGDIGANLAKRFEDTDAYVLAWNMHGHDAKILRRHVPAAALAGVELLDPLKWFRHHFSLPSNTLSSNRPGTPRAVMKAGNYGYLGTEHSALVDTLHMRDVTREAAKQIADKKKVDIKSLVSALNTTRDDDDWMWDKTYWGDNKKLVPERSKDFKRRLRAWLQEHKVALTDSDQARINAFSRMDTLRRYLNDQWEVV